MFPNSQAGGASLPDKNPERDGEHNWVFLARVFPPRGPDLGKNNSCQLSAVVMYSPTFYHHYTGEVWVRSHITIRQMLRYQQPSSLSPDSQNLRTGGLRVSKSVQQFCESSLSSPSIGSTTVIIKLIFPCQPTFPISQVNDREAPGSWLWWQWIFCTRCTVANTNKTLGPQQPSPNFLIERGKWQRKINILYLINILMIFPVTSWRLFLLWAIIW